MTVIARCRRCERGEMLFDGDKHTDMELGIMVPCALETRRILDKLYAGDYDVPPRTIRELDPA